VVALEICFKLDGVDRLESRWLITERHQKVLVDISPWRHIRQKSNEPNLSITATLASGSGAGKENCCRIISMRAGRETLHSASVELAPATDATVSQRWLGPRRLT